MALAPGIRLGPYEILAPLGAGGMGEVYRGHDLRLRRPVALKVLAPALLRDPDAIQRFRREAETASALNHPNILTIYDIGEALLADGSTLQYIAMELIEGRTLRELIREPDADVLQLVGYLQQVATGLAKAHAAGIVHRDLKPENVMVTSDGFAKVLDFGLAKLAVVPAADVTEAPGQATGLGLVLGTIGYMSPEQAAGRTADARSDIFSLGCLLYEAVTGLTPFRGDSVVETLHRVMHAEPPLEGIAPPALAAILRRCLAKKPDARHGSARELAADLAGLLECTAGTLSRRAAPGAPPTAAADSSGSSLHAQRSIAVLPFADLSPGRDHEYIGDGLTDEIITDLSRLRGLRVIARSSAMQYRGTGKAAPEIARELGVEFVLTGSVRVAGARLRISTQLVHAADNRTVWTDRMDGTLDDIFDIQETVARAVAAELRVHVSSDDSGALLERPFADLRAYECYLRARQRIWEFTEHSLQLALDDIARAEELVGENALLLASKAYVYWQYYNAGLRPDPAYLDRADELVDRLASIDPDSPKIDLLRGLIGGQRGQVAEAIGFLRRAARRDPNDVDALTWLVVFLVIVGRCAEARPLAKRLREVDPLNWMGRLAPVAVEFYDGHFQRALDLVQTTMAPSDLEVPICTMFVILVHAQLGRTQEAEAHASLAHDRNPDDPFGRIAMMLADGLAGRRDEGRARLTPDLITMARADAQYSKIVAEVLAVLGDRPGALDWLQHAIGRGFLNYPFVAVHDRLLAGVRDDPRFPGIAQDLRKKWQAIDGS